MTAQTRLSAKGQVVIPKDVRDRLGLVEGTVFDVVERDKGEPSGEEAVANAVQEIRSFYRYEGPPLSLADMDRAVAKAVHNKFVRKPKQ
jgi:AbrB family looped-hinge helix DNA binding protein